ncbi:hypothetical protein LSH36_430g03073 [Paralvinella palmiformis]|uniref:GAR domain-containing protein n=1 Tax=Paralvinella palmiformis TaxID=53620 RepID=A0AAD9JBT7_9ANNE|nr:hypothetical protein LSH36_430g03073 [Paralvinella palmiformis]
MFAFFTLFQFGEKGKMYLVRFLNSTVMVRVGGGWVTLQEFLQANDPCRAKGRTNTELHEQFVLPDGSHQTRAAFMSRRRSQPSNGGSPAGALGSKLSGSATCLTSTGKSNKSATKSKRSMALKSRSCMDLSREGDSLLKRGPNPPVTGSRTSTPRRGSGQTTDATPHSGRRTPTTTTPRSTIANGRSTPTGRRTPTGAVTPTGSRSRSPGRLATPKVAGSARSNPGSKSSTSSRTSVGSRSSTGSGTPGARTPMGSRTPTGSRTPQSQRSRSPVSARSDSSTQRKLASATRTMKF